MLGEAVGRQGVVVAEKVIGHLLPVGDPSTHCLPVHPRRASLEADAQCRCQVAAHGIGVVVEDAGPEIGDPERQAVRVALVADHHLGGVGVLRPLEVASQQGDSPAERFQVVAPSTRRAAIDEQAGVSSPPLVPEGQVAFHVADLGDALPVVGIIGPPEAERVDIEVLAVQVNPLFGQESVNVVGEPASSI